MDFTGFIAALRSASPVIALAATIFGGALTMLSDERMVRLGLPLGRIEGVREVGFWCLLGGAAYLLAIAATAGFKRYQAWSSKRALAQRKTASVQEHVDDMTESEWMAVKSFIDGGVQEIALPYDFANGGLSALRRRGYVKHIADVGSYAGCMGLFRIDNELWVRLCSNQVGRKPVLAPEQH
jgi:hypothetical protein